MYYVMPEGRMKKLIYDAVNRALSEGQYRELGVAKIDSYGKLTVEIYDGFGREENLKPSSEIAPGEYYGGGVVASMNGKKFRIDITEIT